MPKFLLYIAHKYGFPIVRPLQKEILNRGFDVAWFIEIEENKKFIKPEEKLLLRVKEVLSYNPDVVLVATNEVPHFFPGVKVQLFHGFSVDKRSKEKGHFRIRGFFDLYCTQGPSTTEEFKRLAEKHRHFDVVETGWSKVDLLFPVKKKHNEKPVIMLASTFTRSMSLTYKPKVFKNIKKVIKKNTWNWVITLHPKMDKHIVKKYAKLQKYKNVRYVDTLDDIEQLREPDVMFSDTSSVIPEFLIQNKPVVTFKNMKPGNHLLNITDAKDIEKSIQLALDFPEELQKNIQKYIEVTHPYTDGRSSIRVVDACLNFLDENRWQFLKRKPLNLIRKLQMRRRLHYYKF